MAIGMNRAFWAKRGVGPLGRAFAALAVASFLLTAGQAHAQSPADVEAARALFREGVALAESGDYAEAAGRFRRVLEVRAAAPVAYNLAYALAQLGQLVEAAELLEDVLGDPDAPAGIVTQAEQLNGSVRSRIGHLTIRVEGSDAASEVTVDGEPVASGMWDDVRVDPGPHRVVLHGDGTEVTSRDVQVGEGEAVEVELATWAPTAPTPRETAEQGLPRDLGAAAVGAGSGEEDSGGGLLTEWWFWTTVVVVLAAGTVGAILLFGEDTQEPLRGNFNPPLLELEVLP